MKFSQRISYTLFILLSFATLAFNQTEDPTLFTVNGVPVKVSEFLYIYGKNNGKDADYSKKSIDEYLDLYTKFKLKVAKARAMRLDTLPDLKEELHMYKQQVSNSYIMDKEVTDLLIHEVYDRQKKDISVKHVFFQLKANPAPADTLIAYNKAMKAYSDLQAGVPFGKVVQENSDDKSNINYSGDLGYVTAMLPDGFYELENTIYSLPIGEFSKPVRSTAGYHIIRVDDIRPARREMEIAQILIKKGNNPNAKSVALEVYDSLVHHADFNKMVQRYSDDVNTKSKDGYIGFVGINQFDKAFEDAVFALNKDGGVSAPIESRIGWHIIKRISKKEELPFAQAKEKIKALMEADSRYQLAKNRVIERIKSMNGFAVDTASLAKYMQSLPNDFTSFSWEGSPELPNLELFRLGDKSYGSKDFTRYLKTNTQERLQYANGTPAIQVVPGLLKSYINDKVIEFEQGNLSKSYPEFRNLMREYEEGILLFEITRQSVWDKASADTVGLKKYFDAHRSAYNWNERALIHDYMVKSTDESVIKDVYAMSKSKPVDKVIGKFNKKQPGLVTFEKDILEKESEDMKSLSWSAGFTTPYSIDKEKGIGSWKKVEKIMPKSPKTLEESRGYVIADYQDFLEKEWIQALKNEFKVEVNNTVLNSLVKK